MTETADYVGYEYKTVTILKTLDLLWRDSMRSFGWTLEKQAPTIVKHVWGPLRFLLAPLALIPGTPFKKMIVDHESETELEMTFKRDRNIADKDKLNRLQTRFETYARGIEVLEKSKSTSARTGAYFIGLAGTVLMALSMFSHLVGMLPLMIIFAVPGILAWILSYFFFRSQIGKRSAQIEPEIEKQHNIICDVCQRANGILVGSAIL